MNNFYLEEAWIDSFDSNMKHYILSLFNYLDF